MASTGNRKRQRQLFHVFFTVFVRGLKLVLVEWQRKSVVASHGAWSEGGNFEYTAQANVILVI
jgi:hypothetical protein